MGTHPIFESDFDCLTENFKIWGFVSSRLESVWSYFPGKRTAAIAGAPKAAKRKFEDNESENLSPKKKLKTTSNYIYEELFEKGEGSDITVEALDHVWKLHIIYLKQSEYFRSYFCGRWPISDASKVSLEIPDEKIDVEALNTVFGSLYCDEIHPIAPN